MKLNLGKIYFLFFWIFVFVFLVYNGAKYLDADFGWHLRVGQEISEKKAVPDIENYGYVLEGQRWVDHEWFLNLLAFLFYDQAGYFSLIIFYALLALLIFYLLYVFIINENREDFNRNQALRFFLSIFILLGVYASSPHLGVRMQEFTVLFLLLLLVILNQYKKRKKTKILFFLPLLFFVWANFHAGFLIGLFLLLSFFLISVFENLSLNYKKINFLSYRNVFLKKELANILGFILLSFLATLLNPYGLRLYEFLSTYQNNYYLNNIVEWLPFYRLPIMYTQLSYELLALSILFGFFILSFLKTKNNSDAKLSIPLWETFLFALFLYLALKSKRHFPLFFVVSLPLTFYYFIFLFSDSLLRIKDKINLKILSFFALSVFLVLIFGQALKINFSNDPFNSYCSKFPCQISQYLKENKELQSKKVFNQYGWGGYFTWALPEMKLFIDGRLPQFEHNGHSMLEEYDEFLIEDKIEDKIEEYGIEVFIIKTSLRKIDLNWFEKYFLMYDEQKINDRKNVLLEFLRDNPSWEEKYSDKLGSIYVKI